MKESMKEKLQREFEELNADEECIALYSDYTQAELEYNTGIGEAKQEGVKQGVEQGKIDIAKTMLAKGYSPKEISEITKLSMEELEKLK